MGRSGERLKDLCRVNFYATSQIVGTEVSDFDADLSCARQQSTKPNDELPTPLPRHSRNHVDFEDICDQPFEVLPTVTTDTESIQISHCICAMADDAAVSSCGQHTFDPHLHQHNAAAAWPPYASEARRGTPCDVY